MDVLFQTCPRTCLNRPPNHYLPPPPAQPYCSAFWAAAAERDAGYLLLGALCAGGASADVLLGLSAASLKAGAGGGALDLFRVALGPGARDAIDERT
jgi:hypothetical protein